MSGFSNRQTLLLASLTACCIHLGFLYTLTFWSPSAPGPSLPPALQASILNLSPVPRQAAPPIEPHAKSVGIKGQPPKFSPHQASTMPMVRNHPIPSHSPASHSPASHSPASHHLAPEPLEQSLDSSSSPHSLPTSTDPAGHQAALAPHVSSARYQGSHLHHPHASYPMLSRRLGEEGRVLLKVWVNAEGAPEHIEIQISSGFPRLDQAAQDAVSRWNFDPARRDEVAIASWVSIPVVFRLNP